MEKEEGKKNNNRKKKSATIAINACKRASQYQGSKRYSLTQGRDLNQYRDSGSYNDRNTGKRENFTSDTVQIIFEDNDDLSSDESSEAEYLYDDFDRLSDSDSDDDKKREEEAHLKK